VEQVSTKTPYASPGRGFKVVLVDFGSKLGIIRELSQRDGDTNNRFAEPELNRVVIVE
jgi:carbamoyl-phosphate synthase small subunit